MRIPKVWIVTACVAPMAIGFVAQQWAASPGASTAAPNASTQPAATQPIPERPLYAGHAPDEWSSYQAMHAFFLQRFVDARGFGDDRMYNVNDQRVRRVYADGMRYWVGGVQLLSLNGGNAPFAYVTGIDADKQMIKHAAHAPLGYAEIDAIAKLKNGMTVVLTGEEGHREMIGAIRATDDCIQCHDVSKGTLLGAFRYPLLPETPLRIQPAQDANPEALTDKRYLAPLPIIIGVIGVLAGLLWLIAVGSENDGGPEPEFFFVFGIWYIALRVFKAFSDPMSVLPAFGTGLWRGSPKHTIIS